MGSLLLSDPARYAERMRSELHAVVDRLVDSKQLVLGTHLWRIADNVRKRPDSITWKTWEMPSRKNGE